MKITILTYGSRGDVQPFIPLSLGLMARGHSVKLAAPALFKTLVEEQGIQFVPLAGDPTELSRQLNNSGYNFIKIMMNLIRHGIEIGATVSGQVEASCSDANLIIHTFMHVVGAHTIAREKNIPDIHVQLFPMFSPTGDYPNISLPNLGIRSFNRYTHEMAYKISLWASKAGYEQVRRQSGSPKRKLYSPFETAPLRSPTPILCAWSPSVIPPSSDWTSNVHVTGYLFSDLRGLYQPPAELQNFLDAGEPPVCISFGSMVNRDAGRVDRIVRESLSKTNNRGIVLSGWGEVKSPSSKNILYLKAVPHQWLLPRCKMIVHHGGAGTTAAGLWAGIPHIVVPFMADQPFWGSRVYAVGVGPKTIPVKKLSVENLTEAMVVANDTVVSRCAQVLGQKIRDEDGVAAAVELIGKYSNDFLR